MTKEDVSNGRIIPDLLNMKYEYLFRIIGREGKYSLELKCLFLVLIVYVPGLITTSLAGTGYTYVIDDWRRFVAIVIVGLFVWLMIRFLKRIGDKIQQVHQIISPQEKEIGNKGYDEWRNGEGYKKWENWEKKINKYKKWISHMHETAHWWYYFYAIVWTLLMILAYILIPFDLSGGWVKGNFFNELYYRAWFVLLGFLTGACLQFIFEGFWTIRKYCKDVISQEEILPLDPDGTGGLRELGRLALDLDLIVALPSLAFPLYLLGREPEYLANVGNSVWVGISILYALLLVFVFFASISPAHDNMASAKTKYLLKIHNEYKDMHEDVLQKLKPGKVIDLDEYKRLEGLYELYDRVESMAVWPLDFRTVMRFAITSLLPLISVGISISISV